jgi:hypothetical protein
VEDPLNPLGRLDPIREDRGREAIGLWLMHVVGMIGWIIVATFFVFGDESPQSGRALQRLAIAAITSFLFTTMAFVRAMRRDKE